MRPIIFSFLAMIVISVGAYYTLNSDQMPFSAAEQGSSATSVRLD